MAYKKIDKEFCLSDDSVNCYGYRLLTNGLKLERFNPPIGFLMHNREAGVAVRWEDLVVRDGCLFGRPSVNETLPNRLRRVSTPPPVSDILSH